MTSSSEESRILQPQCARGGETGLRVLVKVRGIVQGVGFRPFIYQLAGRCGLNGWVRNQSDGVEIQVAGPADSVRSFIGSISSEPPPMARIIKVETTDLPYQDLEEFRIIGSRALQSRSTLISPDVCTCSDCLRELCDPRDRRFRYPFINCTNCGPRYKIIKDIPYDRDKTTMAQFKMCPDCLREYDNPLDRRFHAQPNACWECGPQVWLEDAHGNIIAARDEALVETVTLLASGAIISVKGLGGFHLAVKARDQAAVSRLRSRKIREEKPFAVMFPDLEEIRRYCCLNSEEEDLLKSPARPIVLLARRPDRTGPVLAETVAPNNRNLGVFLPYAPLHFLLFENAPYRALVMTSGNRSDEPIVMNNGDARSHLNGIADYFLFHDREIYMRCDDSVTRVLGGHPRPMRRARGYAPLPVFLRDPAPPVLGTGAELKNTVCLTRGREAFLSQHIGDLENLETLRSFEHSIAHLERIMEIEPSLIVHDLHPDYLNTQWALKRQDLPRMAAQHHHAHIAAVMAERGLEGPVIGLALDGTGFGTDGTIWGGEILRVDNLGFERLGHFRLVPLPGGAKAIKEPWRTALSYLWSIDPDDVERRYADLLTVWPKREARSRKQGAGDARVILQMLSRRLNCPPTSSCGRLFDAAAALCGVRLFVNYEGQAAIELEQAIEPDDGHYEGRLETGREPFLIDQFPIMEALIGDVRRGVPVGKIAARFHNGVIQILLEAAVIAAARTGLNRIALSGGVFQNAYLSERLERDLCRMGLEVYAHIEVPANDACISLGQAWIGAQKMLAAN
ncbi:MAG: carbamoyltransferase HypF [Syntrophobacteraceae bacterium]